MANEFARNVKDAGQYQTDATMPTADATVYSQDFNLGAGAYKGEHYEFIVKLPSVTVTHLPDADTLTVSICAGAAAAPTTAILPSIHVVTGAGGAGAAASEIRVRLPSDCPQYVRARVVAAGGTGDMSALDFEAGLLF